MTIIGTGEQRRDFTHVLDVVRANVLAINLAADQVFGIYNVGTGVNFSINEIADLIGGERVYVPPRPAEVQETLADISLTVEELNWRPRLKLEEEILH